VIHNAFSHHTEHNAQPIPDQRSSSPGQLRTYIQSITSHVIDYLPGQSGSVILAVSLPSLL